MSARSPGPAPLARRRRRGGAPTPPISLTCPFSQVLLQTSQGDLVIDLHTELAPTACKNFLKLCKRVRARTLAHACAAALTRLLREPSPG